MRISIEHTQKCINDTQHNKALHYAVCPYTECRYAECHGALKRPNQPCDKEPLTNK
jgi:hypothetical protein